MDRAAFFMTLGAELMSLSEKYPHNVFNLRFPRWLFLWEGWVGLVPFRKFCINRQILKKRGREEAGLPQHFTGEYSPHLLKDIAVFRPFSKKEKLHLEK